MTQLEQFLENCCAIDVESTSPEPKTCEIIELAYGTFYTGSWNTESDLYKPSIPVPPRSAEVHFIGDSQLTDKPSFATVQSSRFPKVVDNHKYFIAHNAKFDRTVLIHNYEAHAIGIPELLAYEDRWICTLKLARKLFADDSTIEFHRLSYLWFRLGLDANCTREIIAHKADSDIYMAGKLFELLLAIMVELNIVDVTQPIGPQVIAYQNEPVILTVWPFGKHKGVAFPNIPNGYITWAVTNLDSLDEESDNYDVDLTTTLMQEMERRCN